MKVDLRATAIETAVLPHLSRWAGDHLSNNADDARRQHVRTVVHIALMMVWWAREHGRCLDAPTWPSKAPTLMVPLPWYLGVYASIVQHSGVDASAWGNLGQFFPPSIRYAPLDVEQAWGLFGHLIRDGILGAAVARGCTDAQRAVCGLN